MIAPTVLHALCALEPAIAPGASTINFSSRSVLQPHALGRAKYGWTIMAASRSPSSTLA